MVSFAWVVNPGERGVFWILGRFWAGWSTCGGRGVVRGQVSKKGGGFGPGDKCPSPVVIK